MLDAIVAWSLYTIFGRGLPVPLTPFALAGGASWPTEAPKAWAPSSPCRS